MIEQLICINAHVLINKHWILPQGYKDVLVLVSQVEGERAANISRHFHTSFTALSGSNSLIRCLLVL